VGIVLLGLLGLLLDRLLLAIELRVVHWAGRD
jgi:ABC-type nitrate/sulfonate/bicarbonate transport system permease component